MDSPIPPSITPTIEDKIAKLCVRPHLSSDYLPRFVLIMFESALHSFMCCFAACVMEVIKRHRAGTLEPWPDEEEEAPRCSRYKMKSPPAAPTRRAGAKPVRISPAIAAEASAAPDAQASDAAVAATSLPPTPAPAWQRWVSARPLRRRLRPAMAGSTQPPDRCRSASVFSAAAMRRENCA